MSNSPEAKPEAEPKASQPTLKSVGYDDLLDDIFGLNFRALSTVKDILLRPKAYFDAAKKPGWEDRYTPSFRLVLGFFAILALFKIIFANPESSFFQDVLQMELDNPTETADDATPMGADERVGKTIFWIFGLLPISLFFSWFSLVGLRRIWGEPLNSVVRLRYIFALAVPLLIGIITGFGSEMFIGSAQPGYMASQLGTCLFGVFLVGAVAYRGPFQALPNPSKFFRTFWLTLILHLATIIGLCLAMMIVHFVLA